jgi:quinol monooxygenase YgiN
MRCQSVMVQVFVRLAASRDRARQVAEALRSFESGAKQDRGCESASVYVSLQQPDYFVLEEDWTTEADLRRHVRSGDFTALLELMEISANRPVLEFRFVDHTRGLDYVAEVHGEARPAHSPARIRF